jgi:hypothetical protein
VLGVRVKVFNATFNNILIISWQPFYWWRNLCNQCLSPLMLWVRIPLRWDVLVTTLCDKVCLWLVAPRWFSPSTPVSYTNKMAATIYPRPIK